MGSGKSTVSAHLESHGYTPVKFAATIKRMVGVFLEDLGVSPADLSRYIEGDLKEVPLNGILITPRYMMQTLGNEWGREYLEPDVWVALAMRKVHRLLREGKRVVVDDMRFPSEYDALKAKGALMVRVTRPGNTRTTQHASEGRLDDREWDLEINNAGSAHDLKTHVDKLVLQQAL
jgi:hypothetical protein